MKYSFTQKIKLIKKLAENGIKTEREVKAIQFSDIKNLKLTNNEIIALCDLQEQIKKGKLYSFLAQDEDKADYVKANNNQEKENIDTNINWTERM